MSRFCFCNCPAGFSADPERHAPDCPGRSGAGKARTPVPDTLTASKPADSGVDFGIDGRSVRVSQEAYSIFLARESAGREKIAVLQQRLTVADERADVLESALKFYADRDHYSVDDGLNWDSCSGEPVNILWHESEPWFVEDGSIARSALAESADPTAPKCTYCGDTGQIMTGRSGDAADGNAPTMEPCEDCIPDFSRGNGNKARRRAESLGLTIPAVPTAYDGFDNGTD